MESKSHWRGLAMLVVAFGLGLGVQGCFWFGAHDGWTGKHRGFAYETPEHTSMGHAHDRRSSSW